MLMPNLHVDSPKNPDLIEVQLVNKVEPPPVVLPKPIEPMPEPVQQKVVTKTEPKPNIKPVPAPAVVKNVPAPDQPRPAEVTPHTEVAPHAEVIAVAPKAEVVATPAPPPVVAPEPPKAVEPSQDEINDAKGQYGNTLWNAIGKHKNYPKIAQMRGWQGDVTIELLLDGNGKLKSKKVIQSSGYEALDKQALEMAEKAAPFPTPPEALRGSSFSIKVPIPFKLEAQ